jgi:hypothetical protein
MTPDLPPELSHFSDEALNVGPFAWVCVAGFEDRAIRATQRMVASPAQLAAAVILNFEEPFFKENDRNRARLSSLLRQRLRQDAIKAVAIQDVKHVCSIVAGFGVGTVFLDISSMPHGPVMTYLHAFRKLAQRLIVVYTEAETYYPRRQEANNYLKYVDDEAAFLAACKQEDSDVMFAGLSSVGVLPGFEGRLLPTSPSVIISFPTFKRLRTSSVLADLEVHRKVFLIGRPVRTELAWRARALRVINLDLIDEDTDFVQEVSTLSPLECLLQLKRLIDDDVVPSSWNILICPHGSKMQTVAVWGFCAERDDARVVISHPRQFFPKKYSEGWRETFLLDTQQLLSDSRRD